MALSMPSLVVGGVHFITEAADVTCHGPGWLSTGLGTGPGCTMAAPGDPQLTAGVMQTRLRC